MNAKQNWKSVVCVAMGGLQCAVLFACIVTACAFWQSRMSIRNPENNPLLNNQNLGPLQNATECLEKQKDDPYVLMFRAKNPEPGITCVTVKASQEESSNVYTYERTYFNNSEKKTINYKVMPLKSKEYDIENVIRASLDAGQDPPATPTPPGSMMYIQYADYDCNTSSSPFLDAVKKEIDVNSESLLTSRDVEASPTEPEKEKHAYLDYYVVYVQSNCSVLRAPSLQGACDFWVEKEVADQAVEEARKLILETTTDQSDTPEIKEEKPTDDDAANTAGLSPRQRDDDNNKQGKVETGIDGKNTLDEKLAKAIFKSLPTACRYAFLVACRPPYTMMYDKETCDGKQKTEAVNGDQIQS